MKIRTLGHACVAFSTNKISGVIDPYLGGSCWAHQLSIVDVDSQWQSILEEVDFLIFSHAHDDHYNENFIKLYPHLFLSKVILIPKFKARFFYYRLLEVGFKTVIEVEDGDFIYGDATFKVLINQGDMDSSWYVRDNFGKSILFQTDNLDLEKISSISEPVDVFFYLYATTGIFPLFLETSLENKVKLLSNKRNSWFLKVQEMISKLSPGRAYGYASDLYYSKQIHANLIEILVPYSSSLLKIGPASHIDLSSNNEKINILSDENRLHRISEAIQRNYQESFEYEMELHRIEVTVSEGVAIRLLADFIEELRWATSSLNACVWGKITLINTPFLTSVEAPFSCGPISSKGDDLEINIKIRFGLLYKLLNKELEMGAVSLWNGGMTYWREDPLMMSPQERQFWRAFRRMRYHG